MPFYMAKNQAAYNTKNNSILKLLVEAVLPIIVWGESKMTWTLEGA